MVFAGAVAGMDVGHVACDGAALICASGILFAGLNGGVFHSRLLTLSTV